MTDTIREMEPISIAEDEKRKLSSEEEDAESFKSFEKDLDS